MVSLRRICCKIVDGMSFRLGWDLNLAMCILFVKGIHIKHQRSEMIVKQNSMTCLVYLRIITC